MAEAANVPSRRLFDRLRDAGHLLFLIEQVVADAEHVDAGFQRLKAGLPGAERLLQSLHLHVVADQERIGQAGAQPRRGPRPTASSDCRGPIAPRWRD